MSFGASPSDAARSSESGWHSLTASLFDTDVRNAEADRASATNYREQEQGLNPRSQSSLWSRHLRCARRGSNPQPSDPRPKDGQFTAGNHRPASPAGG
jgi:hypothetical protein